MRGVELTGAVVLSSALMALSWSPMAGCTIARVLAPIEPPPHLEPSPRQAGHFISRRPPRLVLILDWGIVRYLHWRGEETFSSFSLCLFGYAQPGEKRKCFQAYGGVKVDGTETLILRRLLGDDAVYDYVYTPSEQAAFRLEGVAGEPSWQDMGGS